MFGIGAGELVMILVAGLIIFGPSELPKIGRAVGKGLREFRKAQAAFTATLDEVSAEPKKEVGKRNEELEIKQKNDSSLQTPNSSLDEVPAIENISADETPPHSALTVDEGNVTLHPIDAKESQAKENSAPRPKSLTVDEVINLAKQSPLNKEDLNEKNLNGTAGNTTPADASASNVTARSNTDSTDKQSKSAEN